MRDTESDYLLGYAVYLATRIASAIEYFLGADGSGGTKADVIAAAAINYAGQQLAQEMEGLVYTRRLVREFAIQSPDMPLRDAAGVYGALTPERQLLFTAIANNALLRWWIFTESCDSGLDATVVPETLPRFEDGADAAQKLTALDCLIRGRSPEELARTIAHSGEQLLAAFRSDHAAREQEVDVSVPEIASAAEAYARAKRELQFLTIDLEAADLNPDRGQFEEVLKRCFDEALASSHPDRHRFFWKKILLEAGRRFAWAPASAAPRTVSSTQPSSAVVRHATRVLAMVHELHKAGYQRIRATPALSPSGCYWRCNITDADNVASDGYSIVNFDVEGGRVAVYSSGQEADYFGWTDARSASARQLAILFLERFPQIAEQGAGRDWTYAGWLTDVLGRAEQGGEEALLYLQADFPIDQETMRLWRPPPKFR